MSAATLLGLFFATGFAGLVYQVVWLRMLVRVFGSTSLATSNVLAVFMAGLALGAWLAGRRAKALASPLRAYGLVECGLAAAAAAATWLLPLLPELAAGFAPDAAIGSPATVLFRSALSAAALLVPTALMGASFPLVAEHAAREAGGTGRRRTALLYGANTLGAVAGVLASGYWLLGSWGERRTAAAAVAVNLLVGVWAVMRGRPAEPGAAPAPEAEPPRRKKRKEPARPGLEALAARIPFLMALSGFSALAVEVLWTRLLILLLGNSVYAFSSMLAAYLLGLGAGSLACARLLRGEPDLARGFGVLQILAAAAVALSAGVLLALGLARSDAAFLYSPLASSSDFYGLVLTGAAVVFPAAFLYGMLFPWALAVAAPSGSGEAAGRLYAWNTLGSVAGALACGFVLIPLLGTRGTLYALAAVHLGAAALAFAPPGPFFACAAALAALALLLPDPFLAVVRARLLKRAPGEVSFHLEGASSTVTGFLGRTKEHLILINGIIVSGKGDLGRFMAHFPLALREAPRRALVICLGAGNTFRAAVDHGVETELAELEPEVVAAFPRLWPDADAYLRHPRARVRVNDGRNHLLTSRGPYDLIVVDGTPPVYSAGTVNLYSLEFVRLARRRLSADGILALWVPLPCFESDFWMIARNFTDSFPHTLAWAQPGLQGILLLGSAGPLPGDPEALTRRAAARGLLAKEPWLNEGLLDPSRVVPDEALRAGAAAYPNVTDDRPLTEFPLPAFAAGAALRREPDFLALPARR